MTNTVDKTIARDLAALGENSRRDIPPLEDNHALRRADAYRDDRPGAEARRNELFDQRRRELVLLPLAFARVYAHRVARIAGGAAGLLVGFVTLAILADYDVGHGVLEKLPGITATTYGAVAAAGILACYIAGLLYGDRRFERAMRDAISPRGDDVYSDLDHLARGPLDVARAALAKVDHAAVGVTFAGLAAAILATGFACAAAGVGHERLDGGFVQIVGLGRLASNVSLTGVFIIAGSVIGWLLARGMGRAGRIGALLATAGSHVATLSTAVVFGVLALVRTNDILTTRRSEAASSLIAFWSIAILCGLAWLVLWVRRREHARLGVD